MARHGPPPRPDSQPSRFGYNTYRKKPAKASTAAASKSVTMPASIAADPVAVGFWERHAPGLVQAGRLEQQSAEAFALAAKYYSDCQRLEAKVAAEGDTVTGTRGFVAVNPALKHLRDTRRDLLKVMVEFGLTALGSARIPREAEPTKESPLAQFGITG